MRIECKSCGAKGNFDESRLPAGGANVNCPRCKEKIWVSADGAVAPTSNPTEPAAPSGLAAAPAPQGSCTMCQRQFSTDEMVQLKGKWVCGECKPDYVQMLKIGLTQPDEYRYAGFWIRFGAKFIDGIILWIVLMALLFPIQMFFAVDPEQMAAGETGAFFMLFALQLVVQIGIPLAFVTYFIGKFQATPGKMACGIKVIRPDGDELTYMRAFGRYWSELLSSFTLSIGYLMAAFDSEKRALHDRISDTRVVYK